jgi:omega-6 fatty acid desaturase (delta-12 desaturase)
VPYSKAEYDAMSAFGRWTQRFYRTAFGVGAHYFFEILYKKQIFPKARYRTGANAKAYAQDMMALVPYFLLSIAGPVYLSVSAIIAAPWWSALLFVVVIPQLVANWVAGMAVLLHHTHPNIRWY